MEVVLPIAMEHREQCWHTHMGSSTDRGFSAGKIHVVIAGFFWFFGETMEFSSKFGESSPSPPGKYPFLITSFTH